MVFYIGSMKYLIVGLGNPGTDYVDTRHNVGFMVLDQLAEKLKVTPELKKLGYCAQGKHRGRQIHLLMPVTFMNLSGKAVRYYLNKLKIPNENLLVIYDDVALPFGKLRMRQKGSDGGHNGIKNINLMLNSQQYPRLRVGIGNDYPKGQQVDYVLSPFTDEEFEALPTIIDKSIEGILSFVSIGATRTMEQLNRK